METVVLKERPELKERINRVSSYRKHKAFLVHADTVTPTGTYWDGGSRAAYYHVPAQGAVVPLEQPTAPPQFGGAEPEPFLIPRGDCVVRLTVFRGKPGVATVFVAPNEEAKP